MASDFDYHDNQKRCQKQWQEHNLRYYRLYRDNHPEYVQRNRQLQAIRDINRRKRDKSSMLLAKMNSLLKPYYSRKGAIFRLIPQDEGLLAKMDSLTVKLIPTASHVLPNQIRASLLLPACKRGLDRQEKLGTAPYFLSFLASLADLMYSAHFS
ncbi:MAG: hypothetical protein QMD94_03380 [Candidatus Omnitrophota bacterium]|nr:hypothetical protein [Candidatus Omnitrophota bacterium]